MKTAIVFVGYNVDKGYDDSVFFRNGVYISLKFSVRDLEALRYVSRAAFDNSDGVVFVYSEESWADLQKVMLLEFERSSVFVESERPYVIAKGFKEIANGVFFDVVYNRPVLFMPYDLKENFDYAEILKYFESNRKIVKIFEPEQVKDKNLLYIDEVEAVLSVDEKDVKKYVGKRGVYTTKGDSPQEALFEVLKDKGKVKIATAESCTAGLVSARIADIPGVSEFLEGGAVTYSNKLKTHILKVSPNLLRSVGAVSEDVAKAMAIGAINLTNADYAVSVTGIAGPTGATKEKPVGLVYFSVASRLSLWVKRKVFSGNRRIVRDKSSRYAILLLREFIISS